MRLICVVLAFLMLFSSGAAAEGMGIVVIGSTTENGIASADNLLLQVPAEIEGFGTVTPLQFKISDTFGWYRQGYNTVYSADQDYDYAGEDAEYAILWFDILNTENQEQQYLSNYDWNVSAAVVMDERYEFSGWVGQLNYGNGTADAGPDAGKQNTRWVIHEKDQFAIIPMAVGHYMCVCEIPNAVVKSDTSLKMVVKIGEAELTYNIRE